MPQERISIKFSEERIGHMDLIELFKKSKDSNYDLEKLLPNGLIRPGGRIISYHEAKSADKQSSWHMARVPVFVILNPLPGDFRKSTSQIDLVGGKLRDQLLIMVKDLALNQPNQAFQIAYRMPD